MSLAERHGLAMDTIESPRVKLECLLFKAQFPADIAGVQLRTMRQQFLPKAGHATAEEGVAPAASRGVEAGAVAVKGE